MQKMSNFDDIKKEDINEHKPNLPANSWLFQ